jgi:hypothetical protein
VTELPNTWATRDLPLLRECVMRAERGDVILLIGEMASAVGLDAAQARVAANALLDAGYLQDVRWQIGGPNIARVTGVTERARREIGTWPTADRLVDELIAALERAADNEADVERKSRLRQVAVGLGRIGRDVAVGAASTYLGGLT